MSEEHTWTVHSFVKVQNNLSWDFALLKDICKSIKTEKWKNWCILKIESVSGHSDVYQDTAYVIVYIENTLTCIVHCALPCWEQVQVNSWVTKMYHRRLVVLIVRSTLVSVNDSSVVLILSMHGDSISVTITKQYAKLRLIIVYLSISLDKHFFLNY